MTLPSIPGGLPSNLPISANPTDQATINYVLQNSGAAQGLGALAADPQVQADMRSIATQVATEGQGVTELAFRAKTYFDSASALYSNFRNADAASILKAARGFVSQNHEVAGAIDTVSGLVGAAQQAINGHETPQDVVASFSGPVIALMIGAGAISAGVGAAIVAGVATFAGILDSAGVFANKPGVQICPSYKYTGGGTPDYAINCVAVFDHIGPISPGSNNWRRFPVFGRSEDSWWYADAVKDSYNDWLGARWMIGDNAIMPMPIIQAFPQFWDVLTTCFTNPTDMMGNASGRGLVLLSNDNASGWPAYLIAVGSISGPMNGEQLSAFWDFSRLFYKAWESNAAYWINGRHGADDVTVLDQALTIWNRAHFAGVGLDIGASPGIVDLAGGGGIGHYWAQLIPKLVSMASTNITPANKLHINTGALRNAPPLPISAPFPTIAQLRAQAYAKALAYKRALAYKNSIGLNGSVPNTALKSITDYVVDVETWIAKLFGG